MSVPHPAPDPPVAGRGWLSHRLGHRRPLRRALAEAHHLARRVGLGSRYPLRVARYRLSPPGWPDGLTLRVVALADFHFGGSYVDLPRVQTIVERANALEPDLVVLLGDYGASHLWGPTHRAAVRTLADALRGLRAPLGVIGVLGNHDWWDDVESQTSGTAERHDPIIAATELTAAGVTVLENDAVALEHLGQRFWVAGLGDQLAYLGPPGSGVDDLDALTSRLTDDSPALLLAHEPDIFPEVPARYAVTLSGHTHGGQIKLFGATPVVPSRYGSRYVHGHVVESGRNLVVSAGLGISLLPLRVGVPPEIVLLELGRD